MPGQGCSVFTSYTEAVSHSSRLKAALMNTTAPHSPTLLTLKLLPMQGPSEAMSHMNSVIQATRLNVGLVDITAWHCQATLMMVLMQGQRVVMLHMKPASCPA